ncbi:MAG: dipeptidase PepE [Rhodospirillaceae bacterium]|nr:dipeptidase PepE [Rhodospirillaceae bacterium]MDD9999254.1 dipeptidase PepE [Rhodospirillaceae bacterium]MDE0362156.1 dipeptidase PepE [Rhodospirillaceae bacterium]
MSTRRLLLISSSRTPGSGFLEHCQGEIRRLLGSSTKSVLFLPYAQQDHDAYSRLASEPFGNLGYRLESIHEMDRPVDAILNAEAIFAGGGNTFRLLNDLYELELLDAIRSQVRAGTPYVGSSAGTNIACVSIKTTNDMPIIGPPSLDALGLVRFNVNPHYLDPDPSPALTSETRDERIREFHELNSEPVIGLREGSMLRVIDSDVTLIGETGGKLFRRRQPPMEIGAGTRIDQIIDLQALSRVIR